MALGKSDIQTSEDEEVWTRAAHYVGKLGRIPPLFSAPIRALLLDAHNERELANPASQYLVMRLLKSPTFKAVFYYAAMTFNSEQIASAPFLSSYDLVRLHRPVDLAALIGIIFAYRKIRTQIGPAFKKQDQVAFTDIALRIEMACHLGRAVPNIGVSKAVIAAGLPLLARELIGTQDRPGLRSYRKHLSEQDMVFDLEYEAREWGTTCLHISARFLQQLGFGTHLPTDLLAGLKSKPSNYVDGKPADLLYPVIYLWLDSLIRGGVAPTVHIPGSFYPVQKDLYKLLYEASAIREKGSKHKWLDRLKTDIGPQVTPQLYQEVLNELTQTDDVRKFMSNNLPQSLVDTLSDDEIAEIAKGHVDEHE